MKIWLLAPAESELVTAIAYYNGQRAGLGDEFRDEVWRALQRVRDFPLIWHPMGGRSGAARYGVSRTESFMSRWKVKSWLSPLRTFIDGPATGRRGHGNPLA